MLARRQRERRGRGSGFEMGGVRPTAEAAATRGVAGAAPAGDQSARGRLGGTHPEARDVLPRRRRRTSGNDRDGEVSPRASSDSGSSCGSAVWRRRWRRRGSILSAAGASPPAVVGARGSFGASARRRRRWRGRRRRRRREPRLVQPVRLNDERGRASIDFDRSREHGVVLLATVVVFILIVINERRPVHLVIRASPPSRGGLNRILPLPQHPSAPPSEPFGWRPAPSLRAGRFRFRSLVTRVPSAQSWRSTASRPGGCSRTS